MFTSWWRWNMAQSCQSLLSRLTHPGPLTQLGVHPRHVSLIVASKTLREPYEINMLRAVGP